MKMTLALLADYANVSQEGKLNIMGVFDRIFLQAFPTLHPEMRLVMSFEFSAAELGRERRLEVKTLDADGAVIGEWSRMLPVPERPGEHTTVVNQILNIQGMPFERPGDYVFSILVDGDEKGSVPFKVELVSSQ